MINYQKIDKSRLYNLLTELVIEAKANFLNLAYTQKMFHPAANSQLVPNDDLRKTLSQISQCLEALLRADSESRVFKYFDRILLSEWHVPDNLRLEIISRLKLAFGEKNELDT